MKKNSLILACLLPLLPFACSDAEDDTGTTGTTGSTATYFVRFTLYEVMSYEWTAGPDELCTNAFGGFNTGTSGIFATMTGGPQAGISNWMAFHFPTTIPVAGTWTNAEDLSLRVVKDGNVYRSVSPASVTISTYGAVGGAMEGTFSATMTNNTDGGPLLQLSEGSFKVQRLADDTIPK